MESRLIEKTGHTEIRVRLKDLGVYQKLIDAYMAAHGGREIRRNKIFIYFEIDADLCNMRSGTI